RQPAILEAVVPGTVALLEALDEEVVDVGEGMGDAPGDMAVVGEVRESRHTGDLEADRIELLAADMALRVHARHLEDTVRIAGEQRPAAGGARAPDCPVVAAAAGHVG